MAEYLIKEESLKALADLVRSKTGVTEEISLAEIMEQIQPLADVSNVTAEADNVLKGRSIVDSTGAVVAGTMYTIDPPRGNGGTLNLAHNKYIVQKGYHPNQIEVNIFTDTKTITPTKETITVIGKYDGSFWTGTSVGGSMNSLPNANEHTNGNAFLSSVTVNPIPDKYQDVSQVTAEATDILIGKTIVDAQGNVINGTMEIWEGGSY